MTFTSRLTLRADQVDLFKTILIIWFMKHTVCDVRINMEASSHRGETVSSYIMISVTCLMGD